MLGIYLAFLCVYYEHELHLALQTLSRVPLPPEVGRPTPLTAAFERLLRIRAFADPRVLKCWENQIKAGQDQYAISNTLCTERYFHPRSLELLVHLLATSSRLGPGVTFEEFYRVRRHWWHDQDIQLRLETIASRSYGEKYDLQESTRFGKTDFPAWNSMCLSYAHRGDKRIEPICRKALRDQRAVITVADIRHIILGDDRPMPFATRWCDHAMIALLRLHAIDERTVYKDYGMLNPVTSIWMRTDAARQSYLDRNRALFDKLIADYPQVIEKYEPTKEQLTGKTTTHR